MLIHLPPTPRQTAGLRTRELVWFEAQAQGLRKPGIGLPFPLCRVTHPSFRLQVQVRHARDDSIRMALQRIHVCPAWICRYEVDLCRPRVGLSAISTLRKGTLRSPQSVQRHRQLIATAGITSRKGRIRELREQAVFTALSAAGDLLKAGTLYATLGKRLVREATAKGIVASVFGPEWAAGFSAISLLSSDSTACSNTQVYVFDCAKEPVRLSPAWLSAFGYRKRIPKEPEVFLACCIVDQPREMLPLGGRFGRAGSYRADARKAVASFSERFTMGSRISNRHVHPGDGTKPGDCTAQTPPSGGSTAPSGGSTPLSPARRGSTHSDGGETSPSGGSSPPPGGSIASGDSNPPSGGSTPPPGGSTNLDKGNSGAYPPLNVPVAGGVTWKISMSCELVMIYGGSPDSPDSPDGQPELPQLRDYPGGVIISVKTVPSLILLFCPAQMEESRHQARPRRCARYPFAWRRRP
ncbi:hypothetical protein DB88DRAFT_475674 [Papiliotrema laurentii]|uniref:Uncharacterized protein n=1 Tax=Papiliotrema laurentii TaxID=5418 RepID=A0AAD9CUE5_PAPLA|nr:hypothetical protein DB88DRAFT_475674 [Papiliotrema laurentii]